MESAKIIVAADLGDSKIAIVAAEKDENGMLKILGMESIPTPTDSIRNGVIERPSDVAGKIIELSKKLSNRLGNRCQIVRIYTNMNGYTIHSERRSVERNYSIQTKINDHELGSLRNEICASIDTDQDILFITPEEFRVDGEYAANPLNYSCLNIEANYLLALGDVRIRNNMDKAFDRAGIEMLGNNIAILSVADAVVSEKEKSDGCMVVDFGDSTTSFAVFHDGILRCLAVVPFGGRHITNDLCSLNLSEVEAERLKLEKGSLILDNAQKETGLKIKSKPGMEEKSFKLSVVNERIRARMDEIIALIIHEVEISGYKDKLASGIFITGGASKLGRLPEYLKEKTGIDVKMADHAANIEDDKGLNLTDPSYSLIIGTCLNADQSCVDVKDDKPIQPINTKGEKELKEKDGGLFGRLNKLFDTKENL
jgi:cell division protein FtsA